MDLALQVNGVRDAGAVGPIAWAAFAKEARLSARLVLDTAHEVTEAVATSARGVAERVIETAGDAAPIRRALDHVERQSRRALRLFDVERPGKGKGASGVGRRLRR
jgi:hypothetical protein